jgi:MYXO-CTERM domain-containing protein
MRKALSIGVVSLTIVFGMTARAFALSAATAPEIDGSTMSAGLGLLAAGFLIVRSRRRR